MQMLYVIHKSMLLSVIVMYLYNVSFTHTTNSANIIVLAYAYKIPRGFCSSESSIYKTFMFSLF